MLKKIIIGLIAGMISGFFASGGGLILVPSLVYFLGLEENKARATSIFSILPMVLVSAIFYNKENFINWELAIKCAIGGIIGGYLGAKLLKKLSINVLRISFIIFLVYASARMLL